MNTKRNWSYSLAKIRTRFEVTEKEDNQFEARFSYQPKTSRIKQVQVTLLFKHFMETDALTLLGVTIDKKRDVQKIIQEIGQQLEDANLYCDGCRHGDYVVASNHSFNELRHSQYAFSSISLEKIEGLRVILEEKTQNEVIYQDAEHHLYYRFQLLTPPLNYDDLIHELEMVGEGIFVQENGEALIRIGTEEKGKTYGIFDKINELKVSFHLLLRGVFRQGEYRHLVTLQEFLSQNDVSEEVKEAIQKQLEQKQFPLEIGDYTLYNDLFIGQEKGTLQENMWVRLGETIYKVVDSGNERLSLYPAGGNVFWAEQFRITTNYEVVEPPVRTKLEKPILGEVVFPGQDGLFIYGEAHYESQYFYYVKPCLVEPKHYFDALRSMKKSIFDFNQSETIESQDEKEEALFREYEQKTDAPYGYFVVDKRYFTPQSRARFIALERQTTGYTAIEEVVRLHLKGHRIPDYVLDNLIIKYGMDEELLVRLTQMVTDPSKDAPWKKELSEKTERSLKTALTHYPVETYRVLENFLKKEMVK